MFCRLFMALNTAMKWRTQTYASTRLLHSHKEAPFQQNKMSLDDFYTAFSFTQSLINIHRSDFLKAMFADMPYSGTPEVLRR